MKVVFFLFLPFMNKITYYVRTVFVDVSSMAKLDMALSLVYSRVYSRLIRGVMISGY